MKFVTQLAILSILIHLPGGRDWVVYQGAGGPGNGKHVVLISGDEEYRSEEALPMLAKILAVRHGFKCTVLFPVAADGTIDPAASHNIPGMEALDTADLCVLMLRFRELDDAQMKHFVEFLNAGKPIIALRTSTHAFHYRENPGSPYSHFDYRSKSWPGGFGRQVLGETWISHHGAHGKESTRGILNEEFRRHPVLRGVEDIWGPSDVYAVTRLPADARVLVWGQVIAGMNPSDRPVDGAKNNPMMPVVWLREPAGRDGRSSRVVVSTMGAAVDLECKGLRRLLVNACYWALGIEDRMQAGDSVEYVGDYRPAWFGFGGHRKGLKPADLELR